MKNSSHVELRVGCKIWLEGSTWDLAELGADSALLISGESLKRVQTSYLVTACKVLSKSDHGAKTVEQSPPSGLLLSSLPTKQRLKVEEQSETVRLAQAPPPSHVGTNGEWIEQCAQKAGVSARTLRRWMRAYDEGGPAALADNRTSSRRTTGVDERWNAACRAVLASYVEASTPTADVILEQTKLRLADEYGPDVVSVPSRATQYRRLKEI